MPRVFVDTNILLYAVSNHPEEREKTSVARDLLLQEDCGLSVQVLGEFFVNATRPHKLGLSAQEAELYLLEFEQFPVAGLTLVEFHRAVELVEAHLLSYWDSLILATAETSGCEVIFTEDLSHGVLYGKVRVVNPFAK